MTKTIHLDDDRFHDQSGVLGIFRQRPGRGVQMSKLVNWGRWIAAVIFFVELYGSAVGFFAGFTITLGHTEPGRTSIYLVNAFSLVASLAVAWGLIKLRRWAYLIAIVYAILIALTLPFVFKYKLAPRVGFYSVPEAAVLLGCCIWLLLPQVRTAYSRRNQIA